jgi:hypothetical protein
MTQLRSIALASVFLLLTGNARAFFVQGRSHERGITNQ